MALQNIRSNTSHKRPTASGLSDGQIAINTNADSPGLFFKDAGGALIKVGPVHIGTSAPNSVPAGSSGNAIGEQWLDTSNSGYVFKIWDGTAWRSETGQFVDVAGDTMTGNLTISGADLIMSSGEIVAETGAAATPSITFTGDLDTGFYKPAADQIAISTGGTGRVFINDSGNVGIGTSTSDGDKIRISSENEQPVRIQQPTNSISKDTSILLQATNSNGSSSNQVELVASANGGGNSESAFFLNVRKNADSFDSPGRVLTALGSGNVGIGTSSPGFPLVVSGENSTVCRLSNTANSSAFLSLAGSNSTQAPGVGCSNNDLVFNTAFTERFRIDSDGNVGIGTSSPFTTLSTFSSSLSGTAPATSGTTDTTTAIRFGGGVVGIDLGILANGTSYLQNRNINKFSTNYNFAINPNGGNVGIGTSSPGNKLTIRSTASDQLRIEDNAGDGFNVVRDTTTGFLDFDGTQETFSGFSFSTTPSGGSLTERYRITNPGRHRYFSSDATVAELSTSSSAGTTNFLVNGKFGATGIGGGSNCLLIYSNGNIQNSNNSYGAISDVKLKENIVDANSQWDDLKALQIRNYNFKEGQIHTQIGVVAQEVELVSPGLVTESPDRDDEGNDLGTVTKSVNYSVLYMKAVKALQEAMERIEALEQRLSDAGL